MSHNFLITILVCLAQVYTLTAASKDCLNISSKTFIFNAEEDSFTNDVFSFHDCLDACLNTTSCQAFTWDEMSPLKCLLFIHIRGLQSCGQCQTGILPTQILPENTGCAASMDDVLATTETESAAACLEQCNARAECQYVTWYNSESEFPNFCFQVRDCGRKVPCYSCQSWQLNCLHDECFNYKIMDDATRNNHHSIENYCDSSDYYRPAPDWQGAGWYRMLPPAGAVMPEVSPGMYKCGTTAPGWLDGRHPTSLFQTISARVCFAGSDRDCYGEGMVNVTNCDQFYVYQLPNTPYCRARYCSY